MYQYRARLGRVVDGDTVVLDLDLGFYQWRVGRSYRLARIDAPELRNEGGEASKGALATLLAATVTLLVITSKADSFDRWIVDLFADGSNVSDWLVSNGFATYRVYA